MKRTPAKQKSGSHKWEITEHNLGSGEVRMFKVLDRDFDIIVASVRVKSNSSVLSQRYEMSWREPSYRGFEAQIISIIESTIPLK